MPSLDGILFQGAILPIMTTEYNKVALSSSKASVGCLKIHFLHDF